MPTKKLTPPQAATLRYLLYNNWQDISFTALDVFPTPTRGDSINRTLLARLHEAGCLTKNDQDRYVIDLAATDAALQAVNDCDADW